MPASIGVNLRVTGHCRQGGRKYMEDFFSVAYQQSENEKDLEYAFCGIYDGHGGAEAAFYAKEHLMETIIRQKHFWSYNDEDVLRAIKDGYVATHYAMWKEQEKWPRTASGLPSTAGTTASVAFIRRGKIYIGHVGDSGIILGYQDPDCPDWKAKPLTKDHKPESAIEMNRIEQCGGKVVSKSGVPRVVWNRPRIGHQGPVRRSTPIDEIPFLAVARSLGDLWSYNSQLNEFVVSPDPDCNVIPIDTNMFRCLIFGTDGLHNMVSPEMAVHIVQQAERHNESAANEPNKVWLNPSKCLVEKALERWSSTKMRADNTSVVTLMLDPPGPPRVKNTKNKKKKTAYGDSGLEIVTRYENNEQDIDNEVQTQNHLTNCLDNPEAPVVKASTSSKDVYDTNLTADGFVPRPKESLPYDPRETGDKLPPAPVHEIDENIQINEISSSCNDVPDYCDSDCGSIESDNAAKKRTGKYNTRTRMNNPSVRMLLRKTRSSSSASSAKGPIVTRTRSQLLNRSSPKSKGTDHHVTSTRPKRLANDKPCPDKSHTRANAKRSRALNLIPKIPTRKSLRHPRPSVRFANEFECPSRNVTPKLQQQSCNRKKSMVLKMYAKQLKKRHETN